MVNAEEVEEQAPPSSDSVSSRLPPQLNRLPADKLVKVHEALGTLKEAGLTDVKDLAALSECVKANTNTAGNARMPSEDLTSEYMGANLWAWTPKRWFDSIQAQGAPAGAKSEEAGNGNEASEDQLPPIPANLQERFDRHLAKMTQRKEASADSIEEATARFNEWFSRMMQNDAEIRSLATMDRESMPIQKGDGVGVWFDPIKTAPAGRKVLGKVNLQSKDIGWIGGKFSGNKNPAKANVAPSVISLHLGAEGGDSGAACWKRLMEEHSLDGNGRPIEGHFYGSSTPFFAESTAGRYVPRAIFAGYDADRLNSLSATGQFAPTSVLVGGKMGLDFVSGEEDDGYREEIMEGIRQQMEKADFVEGFLLTHDLGEGLAMSGMTSKLLSDLSCSYGKQAKMTLTCVPDLKGEKMPLLCSALLCPSLLEFTELVNFYDVASLRAAMKPSEQPSGVVARVFSGMTGPMRFGRSVSAYQGSRLSSLNAIQVNLVCYPRIHFALPGIACGSSEDGGYGAAAKALTAPLCSVEKGKSIAFALMGRGAEQSCLISRAAAYKLSKECDFVDYSPTGFAISTFKDEKSKEAEIVALQNTTAVGQVFKKLLSDGLDSDTSPNPFAAEGHREESMINETRENLAALMSDYDEIAEVFKPEEREDDEEFEE